MGKQVNQNENTGRIDGPLKRVGAGIAAVAALGGIGAVGYQASTNPKSLEDFYNSQIKFVPEEANPSTMMAEGFNAFTDAAEIAGYGALVLGAVSLGRRTFDKKYIAVKEMASAERKKSGKKMMALGGATAISTVAVFGTYVSLADGTARSQSAAAQAFAEMAGSDEEVQVLGTSPEPELFNSSSVPKVVFEAMNPNGTLGEAELEIVPVNTGFNNIMQPNGTKILASTYAVPSEAIEIDPSLDECKTVGVEAPMELGKKIGETFILDGLTVTVEKLNEGKAGVNLFPVGMTTEDFDECLNGGVAKTPNILLIEGSEEDVRDILTKAGVNIDGENEDEPQNRVYVAPIDDMLENSQKTGENTVNGLVSLALMTGSIFIGIAIGGNNRNAYKNDQLINATRLANGFSQKDIIAIYAAKSSEMAWRAWMAGVGGVVAVTAAANSTMAGASMGLDAGTAAASLGYITGMAHITNFLVGMKDVPKANIAENKV